MTHRVAAIIGTRPEAIKVAPIIHALTRAGMEPVSIFTGQHENLALRAAAALEITPDVELHEQREGDSLADLTGRTLVDLDCRLGQIKPELLLVQGDTTSAFVAALAAFYRGIPISHIEAGLRTGDLSDPFPEEGNRQMIARLAAIHFAPTQTARAALLAEGIAEEQILVTGNTAIDALQSLKARRRNLPPGVPRDARILLVEMHRRESWGEGVAGLCQALREITERYPDVHAIWPVHPAPAIREQVTAGLRGATRIHLQESMDYVPFIELLKQSWLVLSDSGGLEEEAPAVGVPMLVLRDTTERPEAIAAGTARLAGTKAATIVQEATHLLDNPAEHARMAHAENPFGDGRAANRIVESIGNWFATGSIRLAVEREFVPTRRAAA